jgi:hypothetical protein
MFGRKKKEDPPEVVDDNNASLEGQQPFRKAILPVIACGAGLFSDGYINNVSSRYKPGPIGFVRLTDCVAM